MKFEITIESGNAAFEPDPVPEIHRLLGVVAAKLARDHTRGVLTDTNGNTVGHWSFTGKDHEQA